MTGGADLARGAASMLGIGFDGPVVTPHAAAILERGVRCVVLFARNFTSRGQVAALCAELHELVAGSPDPDLLVCVDQEGGRVQRFREGFSEIPAARAIGAYGASGGESDASASGRGSATAPDAATNIGAAAAEAARWGAIVGRELREVGIDLNFAPVVDVDTNPDNPVIGARSFGRDPALVSACATAFIGAQQAAGVAACAKHFPGHGDTTQDSHHALPRLPHAMERLQRVELPPFKAAIAAGVASVMVSHVLFEALDRARPSTLSPSIIDQLLRRTLGFDGLVFTDDLEMKAVADLVGVGPAAAQSIAAGCDIALVCADPNRQLEALAAIEEAIASGRIDADRVIRASARRFAACSHAMP